MIDWNTVLDKAEQYQVHRLDSITRYLPELKTIVGKKVQNWTDPYGRGYQYEFELSGSNPSISLIVEISAVTDLATAYFVCRTFHGDGSYHDECTDILFTAGNLELRERVLDKLRSLGFRIVSYEDINVIRRGKPTYCWVFHDPED